MPIHHQLWSLEFSSVVETVASFLRHLRGVTSSLWRRSHFPDKVGDIHTVRKSSTDQCNSSGHWRDKSADSAVLYPIAKKFCLGLLHVSFLRQKIRDVFYEPPGILILLYTLNFCNFSLPSHISISLNVWFQTITHAVATMLLFWTDWRRPICMNIIVLLLRLRRLCTYSTACSAVCA